MTDLTDLGYFLFYGLIFIFTAFIIVAICVCARSKPGSSASGSRNDSLPPDKLKTFVPDYPEEKLTDAVANCGNMILNELDYYDLPLSVDQKAVITAYLYSVFNLFSIRFDPSVRYQYNKAIVLGLHRFCGLTGAAFTALIEQCSAMNQTMSDIVFGRKYPKWHYSAGSILPRQSTDSIWHAFFPELPLSYLNVGLLPLCGMAYLLNPSSCKPPYRLRSVPLYVRSLLPRQFTPPRSRFRPV